MTRARIRRITEQDTRVMTASCSIHCAIRDGRNVWTPEELADLQDIEARLEGHLGRLRQRLRAEFDVENQERYPQQPGGTA
jgi:hypothetical protein